MISRSIIGKEIARQLQLSQSVGKTAVDIVFETIRDGLVAGKEVRITGIGTFKITHHTAREGSNPRTGEKIAITAWIGVTFRPHKALKDALNQPSVRKVGGDRNSPMPQRKRA